MDTKRLKVVALLRVSTAGQQDGDKTGIARQQADIEFNCDRFGLEVVETFPLTGISGAIVQDTPEFKRMLKTLARPEIRGVVLSTLDRFLRPENLDAYAVFKIFRQGQKKMLFCDTKNPLDVTDSQDRATIVSQLENAAAERQRIKYRTQRAKEILIRDPEISITRLPKGVEHVKNTKKYGPKTKKGFFRYTPYAFETVAPAFEMVLSGKSLHYTARELGFASEPALRNCLQNRWWLGINERTHKRPTEYNEALGEKKAGKRIKHDKPIVHHTNLSGKESLVKAEVFEKVQTLLALNRTTWSQNKSNTDEFLGVGLLMCSCGCKTYLKFDTRSGKQPSYVCSSYRTPSGPCGNPRMGAVQTDRVIWASAIRYLTDVPFLSSAVKQGQKSEDFLKRAEELERAKKTLEGLEKRKKAIQKMVAMDDDEDAINMYSRVKHEIAEAKIRLATAQAQVQPFGSDDPVKIAKTVMARFVGLHKTGTIKEKRSILLDVIERVTVDSEGRGFFTVRGGLPIQQEQVMGDKPGTTFDAVSEAASRSSNRDAKMESSSSRTSSMPA